ncbi:MAG TPA: hypothetical protein VG722_06020, partial [Tepidisphaeraceae bacterium]|nr:hypothetical protein [Tepidisphaeraceae bacterium]
MKKMSMVAAGLMLMTGMASADVIATYDFGNFSAGVISPLDDVTVSLGVAPDYSDLSDPATAFLFDDVLPKTGPSSYTFIINSTNDGNWLISTTRLANGANRNLSPYVVYGSSGITTYLTTTEFDDGYDPFVFPSTVDLSTTPITSIEMDITDVSFYQQNVFDTDFY